jgi:CobQ/CobB/MinD/ParA family nucleotide binding protein
MITISFYSYKGGVGRSLTLANLGVYLSQFGATVVMVDFDLEAPGLHYKFRPEDPIEIPHRGLAGLLADASQGKSVAQIDWNLAIDVSEHARSPAPTEGNADSDSGRLYLVPAGNPMLPSYWNDLAAIDWDGLFVADGRPGVFALSRLKEQIENQINPDVLLVDSRTGITPGGGVSTTLLPDVVVMMMLNTPEHVDGSRLVASAVSGAERAGEPGPAIIPVLSRYTSPQAAEREFGDRPPKRIRARNAQLQMVSQPVDQEEDIPLLALGDTLMEGLPPEAAGRLRAPLVLHADPLLQQREYLTFGRYAQSKLGASGQTLLEDYLRLFAALVPEDTFLKYMSGVRERARSILLDNPEDAVRSLESLVTLTGDEGAFSDLAKVYLLRRDAQKLISAAESLYRVHGRIVPEPDLTTELRNLLTGRTRAQRLASDEPPVSASFAEAYWRGVARDDVEFGGSIAKLFADRGDLQRGRSLAEEIIERNKDPKTVAAAVRILALGGPGSEIVAVEVAMDHFDSSKDSGFFMAAAATAARYRRERELAQRIVESSGRESLDPETQVRLLEIAGDVREAAGMFIETFAVSDPDDVDLNDIHDLWISLGKHVPEMRMEFRERNPELAEQLDAHNENPF